MDFVQVTDVMGNVGEFVGSFAVLATLVYLAVQVNQSKGLLEMNQKLALHDAEYKRSQLRNDLAFKMADFSEIFVNRALLKPVQEAMAIINNMSLQDQTKMQQLIIASLSVARFTVSSAKLGLLGSDLEGLRLQMKSIVPIAKELGIRIPPEVEDFMKD